jgi:4'-phosphopantetheinyl transferase
MEIYVAKLLDKYDENMLSKLDPDRRKRVERLKHEKEKLRSLTAGLLLRYCYCKHEGEFESWGRVTIKEGQYGKPFIEGDKDFLYSLSHSGEYVLCAVDNMEIGADIQVMDEKRTNIAGRFFHESECERINNSPHDLKTKEFYKIWTAKESVVKLSGRGMGEGIKHLVTNKRCDIIDNIKNNETFNIKIYDEIEDYIVCVCSRGDNFPDNIIIVNGDSLS